MIVYKATNRINGKVYVGQTTYNLQQRRSTHIAGMNRKNNTYFHNALLKYGIDNFMWQIICICPNIDSLNEQEQYYIALYDSMNTGYNLQSGGLNYRASEETKRLMRKNHVGMLNKKHSEKTKQKMSKNNVGMLGKHHSEESKQKMRVAALNMSDETKQLISKNNCRYFLDKHHTEETKEKIRQSRLGKKRSKETKAKISKAQLKRWTKFRENNTKEKHNAI